MEKHKVVIIGDGFVGSTTAYTLMVDSSVNEIVIIDINKEKVTGDVLDMLHGMPLLDEPKRVKAGDYQDVNDADIIIITAGVSQKNDQESRLDLLKRNLQVFDSIIAQIKPRLSANAIVLVVTNPVDVLSYYTYKKLGIPASRVIGSGTVLDTQRLRYLLSNETGVDPRNVHAFVVGEHGDSEVMAFSVSTIGGIPFANFCDVSGGICQTITPARMQEIAYNVRHAAYDIIRTKGSTYYAVALAIRKIVEAILNDSHSVLTVSSFIEREFNGAVQDLYFSLPCIVSAKGVRTIIRPHYSKDEIESIVASAAVLKKLIIDLQIKD